MEVTYTPPPANRILPAGTYTFEVLKFAMNQKAESDREKLKKAGFTAEQIADASGKISIDQLAVTFTVTAEEGEPIQAKESFTLSPNLFWKMKQFRAACGFNDGEGHAVKVQLDEMVGCTGSVKVAIKKKFNGDGEFNEFTWLKPDVSSGAEAF
jgi:hypothetical protein